MIPRFEDYFDSGKFNDKSQNEIIDLFLQLFIEPNNQSIYNKLQPLTRLNTDEFHCALVFIRKTIANKVLKHQMPVGVKNNSFLYKLFEKIEARGPEFEKAVQDSHKQFLEMYYGMEWDLEYIMSDKNLNMRSETNARLRFSVGETEPGPIETYSCDLKTLKHIVEELEFAHQKFFKTSHEYKRK